MKKALVLALVLLAIYLNRSYAHIFNFISAGNLINPTTDKLFMISNSNKEKIKIAFLGDSLTAGAGATRVEATFPRLIANRLSNNHQVEILNLAVPGATTEDVLFSQVEEVKNFQPDKLVLFVGINDLSNQVGPKEVKSNLKKIIDRLDVTKENLYLINIPYLGTKKLYLPPYRDYYLLQTMRYNKIFKELKVSGYKVIDLYEETVESFKNRNDIYSVDNFHPNDLGYQIFAEVIYKGMF